MAARPRVEIDDILDAVIELVVALVRMHPHVEAPRLEVVLYEDTPDRLVRYGLHDAVLDQLAGNVGALPMRQRLSRIVRTLAGQLNDVDGHFRREKKAFDRVPACRATPAHDLAGSGQPIGTRAHG